MITVWATAILKTKDITDIARISILISDESKKANINCYQIGKLYIAIRQSDFENDFSGMITVRRRYLVQRLIICVVCILCLFCLSACNKDIDYSESLDQESSQYNDETVVKSAESDDLNLSNSSQNDNTNSSTNNNGVSSIESTHSSSILIKPNDNTNSSTNNNGVSSIESTHSSSILIKPEENEVYKLYYVVDSGIVGIMGFDDGISSSNVSTMKTELEAGGYSVHYIEINGKSNIIIPTHIDGCIVYAIDGGAFTNCTSIISVTIPKSVEVIEPGAFRGCSSNLIIYGDMNSKAQSFANENGICFKQQ